MSLESSQPHDADLLRQVAAGSESALRELVDRHSPWLSLRLRRRIPDTDLIASVLQDTFVAVWRGANTFRNDGDVGAWLWGIAIRQLISGLRKRAQPAPTSAAVFTRLLPEVRSAEDEVLRALEHGPLSLALSRLSPDQQRVLQATVLDGLTTREAARLLNIPTGTVNSRARLAREHLRRFLLEEAT